MQEKFSTLILEDNLANIELLKLLIAEHIPALEIIGEAQNSEDFVSLFLKHSPEILILDIEIGEKLNSLEVISKLDLDNCEVILVSSHEKYAIDAINMGTISGYVLKPVKIIDLSSAIFDVTKKLQKKKILQDSNKRKNYENDLLAIPLRSSIEFVKISDILYLEADGQYTIFYMSNNETKLVSKNIGEYEKTLPQDFFFRIHYKHLVNINKVSKINKTAGNHCEMTNGISLSIAKRRQEPLRRFLDLK